MHEHAAAADDQERYQAGRHDAAGKLAEQVGGELPGDEGIELRFAMQPLPEIERHLAMPERMVGRQYVEQQLEAGIAQRRRGMQEGFAADDEKAGERVDDIAAEHEGASRLPSFDRLRRNGSIVAASMPVELTRGADDVGLAGADRLDHPLDGLGIVLAVAVHDAQQIALGRQHALDAGLGKAAVGDAQHQPHAVIGARHGAHHVRGAVGRTIVDEQDLPVEARRVPPRPASRTERYCRLRYRWERRSRCPNRALRAFGDGGKARANTDFARACRQRAVLPLPLGHIPQEKKPAGSTAAGQSEDILQRRSGSEHRPSARPSRSPATRRRRGW